jgi:cytidylate kinase
VSLLQTVGGFRPLKKEGTMAIITISRGTFSGGETVAKGVAERLGYRCVSREVVLEAAWGYGVSADELVTAMDRRPPLWRRVAGERSAYITLVRAALCEHALGGNLVYHGHVGHLFLPGISHVISVRVVADMEFRIQAAMEHHQCARKDAIARIEKVDKERQQWTRFLFDVDWDDPHLYDLVLNLSRMSVSSVCEAVANLTTSEKFKPTTASLKALQDLALRSRVEATLATDARTTGMISGDVLADDGIVTIRGTTQSPMVVEAVSRVVCPVEGVKEVRSAVRLLREGSESRNLTRQVLRTPEAWDEGHSSGRGVRGRPPAWLS